MATMPSKYMVWKVLVAVLPGTGIWRVLRRRWWLLVKPQRKFRTLLLDPGPGAAPFRHLQRCVGRGATTSTNDIAESCTSTRSAQHPYATAIHALIESTAAASQLPPLPLLPLPLPVEQTPLVWVNTKHQLLTLAEKLSKVSTGDANYIIDAMELHDEVGAALHSVLADPGVVKVMHGVHNDVLWLQRDFHCYLVNVFDTQVAASQLGYLQTSLAHLLRVRCGAGADKRCQRSDWRIRPLPQDMLRYAAMDVHYGLYIAGQLGADLAADGGTPAAGLAGTGKVLAGSHAMVTATEHTATATTGTNTDPAATGVGGAGDGVGSDAGRCRAASGTCDEQGLPQELLGSPAAPQLCRVAGGAKNPLAAALARSHQLTLTLFQQPDSEAALAAAATALLRQHLHQAGTSSRHGSRAQGDIQGGPSVTNPAAELAAANSCIFALCKWRDEQARRDDDSVAWILPDAALLALAAKPPVTPGGLRRTLRDVTTRIDAAMQADVPHAARIAPSRPAWRSAAALCTLLREAVKDAAAAASLAGGSGAVGQAAAAAHRPGRPQKQRADPVARREMKRQWIIDQFTVKTKVYEGCRMLSSTGELLCHCDERKLRWYEDKGLAERVPGNTPTIRLLFKHKVGDQASGADAFYAVSKRNACVVCGEDQHFLRYRVVPACYRRFLPPALKSHRSHDVVLLCVDDHETAHKAAEHVKRQIANELGIPLLPGSAPRPWSAAVRPAPPSSATAAPPTGAAAAAGPAELLATPSAASVRLADRPLDNGCNNASPSLPDAASSSYSTGLGQEYEGGASRSLTAGATGSNSLGDGADQQSNAVAELGGRVMEAELEGAAELAPLPDLEEELASHQQVWAARRAALALQRQAGQLPESRVRELEDVVLQFLGRDNTDDCKVGQRLQPEDMQMALLAGLNGRKRTKLLRKAAAAAGAAAVDASFSVSGGAGAGEGVHGTGGSGDAMLALAGSAAAVAVAKPEPPSGQLWHGERVVRRIMETQGEAGLLELMRRFRSAFVEVCQPRHLPASWGVDHSARREFGSHSIFAKGTTA